MTTQDEQTKTVTVTEKRPGYSSDALLGIVGGMLLLQTGYGILRIAGIYKPEFLWENLPVLYGPTVQVILLLVALFIIYKSKIFYIRSEIVEKPFEVPEEADIGGAEMSDPALLLDSKIETAATQPDAVSPELEKEQSTEPEIRKTPMTRFARTDDADTAETADDDDDHPQARAELARAGVTE